MIPWLINNLLFHTTPAQLSAAIAILQNLGNQRVIQDVDGSVGPEPRMDGHRERDAPLHVQLPSLGDASARLIVVSD